MLCFLWPQRTALRHWQPQGGPGSQTRVPRNELRVIGMHGGYGGIDEYMANPKEALAYRTRGKLPGMCHQRLSHLHLATSGSCRACACAGFAAQLYSLSDDLQPWAEVQQAVLIHAITTAKTARRSQAADGIQASHGMQLCIT